MFIKGLRCLKCGEEYDPYEGAYTCRKCGGKLEVLHDYEKIADEVDLGDLGRRGRGVWRYKELMPVLNTENMISMGEGSTPLLRARDLGEIVGIDGLYLKDETRNLTSSFKDRSMCVGASKAVEFGAGTVVTASSGNAAASLAAYSARANLMCYAFVPEDAPVAKVAQISIHGARAVRVSSGGDGDPTYELMQMAFEDLGWHPVPSAGAFNPYQPEGSKTISYEICESLEWEAPDLYIVPVGAGTLLSGSAKGFFELEELGVIDEAPKVVGIQAEGCAPFVKGFKEDLDPYEIPIWESPETVAGGLADPYPWDADTAIPVIRRSGGTAEAVSDDEILEAVVLLARSEGIFAEPSGAAALAGLIKLKESGAVDPDERAVVCITGGGLKEQKVAAELVGGVPTIEPSLRQLKKVMSR